MLKSDSGSARKLETSDLSWLTDEQLARPEPFFRKSHGRPRVDDRRVSSGIILVNCNGLRWRDTPRDYAPHKTLYNRWKRWSAAGNFVRLMDGLAVGKTDHQRIMIDATCLKAHRGASSLRIKRGPRLADREDQRRHEHEAARDNIQEWPPDQVFYDGRPDQR